MIAAPRAQPRASSGSWLASLEYRPLQFVAGWYCGLVGACMLLAPHHFTSVVYGLLYPQLTAAGVLFFLSGLALASSAVLRTSFPITAASYLAAAACLAWLLASYVLANAVTGMIGQGFLLAALLAGLAAAGRQRASDAAPADVLRRDLLPLVIGATLLVLGTYMALAPASFSPALYASIAHLFPPIAAGFVVGGGGLIFAHGTRRPLGVVTAAVHVVAAASLLVWLEGSSVFATRSWPPLLFYGGYAVALLAYPALRWRLQPSHPQSLRARITMSLVAAAALPLLLAMTIVGRQEERVILAEALQSQRNRAAAYASDIAEYIDLHRAGIAALAAQPEFLELTPERQSEILATYLREFPASFDFALADAAGDILARGVGPVGVSVLGYGFAEEALTGRPSIGVVRNPELSHPLIGFAHPITDSSGAPRGLILSGIDGAYLEPFLAREGRSHDLTYIVDGSGDVAVRADSDALIDPADVSDVLAARTAPRGTVSFTNAQRAQYASYADIPALDWTVVVQRPARDLLAVTSAGRDIIVALFFTSIVAVALLGGAFSRRLTSPLASLAASTRRLDDDTTAPAFPRSSIVEVQELTDSFEAMFDRLRERTDERNRKEAELLAREAQYRQLVESTRVVPWERDAATGVFTYVGPQSRTLLGYPTEAWTQPGFWTGRIHPEDRERYQQAMRNARGRASFTLEYRALSTSDRYRWLQDVVSVEYGPDGSPSTLRGFLIDVSAAKRGEEARRNLEIQRTLDRHLESERRRIGQEMHDGIRQQLAGIRMLAAHLERQLRKRNAPEAAALAEFSTLIGDANGEVRRLINGLIPPLVEADHLGSAIQRSASYVEQWYGVPCVVTCRSGLGLRDDTVANHLFYIAQEALTNAAKHSGATRLEVTLERDGGDVVLTVRDDGRGLPPDFDKRGSLGIQSLRDRAQVIGASVAFESPPAGGTVVRCRLPLA